MFKNIGFCSKTFKKTLVDGGYTGDNFAEAIRGLTGAAVEAAKRSELYKFAVIPEKWIKERSFGWFYKCRLLWENCERYLHNN